MDFDVVTGPTQSPQPRPQPAEEGKPSPAGG